MQTLPPPTPQELSEHAYFFFQRAWDDLFSLINTMNYITNELDFNSDEAQRYWLGAQKKIVITQALAQQGAELLIKSIIASESPFILFEDLSRLKNVTDFYLEKTVGADSLIKICNFIFPNKISNSYINVFEKYRSQRNSFYHTAYRDIHENKYKPKDYIVDTLKYIIESSHLLHPLKFLSMLKNNIENGPDDKIFEKESSLSVFLQQAGELPDLLNKKILKEKFMYEKGQRDYLCPACQDECNYKHNPVNDIKTAQLKPNKPTSFGVRCYVCTREFEISRDDCVIKNYQGKKCPGNVIYHRKDSMYSICLTCGEEQLSE